MNCYGITEKRVRMQRERCISRLAPGHYKNSPFGKKHKLNKTKSQCDDSSKKSVEFTNGLEITPLDLRNEKKKNSNFVKEAEVFNDSVKIDNKKKDVPLDLSHRKMSIKSLVPSSIEIDRSKLYEIAKKIGVSKERIDKEMAQKYEQLVWQNLKKQQKSLAKFKKRHSSEESVVSYNQREIENRSPSINAVAEQVIGLGDDLTILPIQTLNNGDLTISPVLGHVSKPVENRDIMQVNTFFQNQLWKPEYIGLSSWRKLRNQSFEI